MHNRRTDDTSGVAILLESVTFTYPKGRTVLDIEQFSVRRGESIFLHGPSGAGKTTLLSLIAGVLQPSSGKLRVLGHDLAELGAGARDRLRGSQMGYIFQGLNLIPYLSVGENIALPCKLHHDRLDNGRRRTLSQEIERLATRLDIQTYLQDPVSKLSLGQQQRVAIARALIGSPPLVIADEPTSSLDVERRSQFLDLMRELLDEARTPAGGTTLIFVSHDHGLAQHFQRTVSLRAMNAAGRETTS